MNGVGTGEQLFGVPGINLALAKVILALAKINWHSRDSFGAHDKISALTIKYQRSAKFIGAHDKISALSKIYQRSHFKIQNTTQP
ncbi:gamma-glutamyl:cysteine ligase YbdK (ATP-grasp superfamily) [Alkalibacillus filiformis]|uniref:Gamma-glutamyl:cysteine ligase YbdK (ATP-grasp superfamily) n=1 Tax=Alkalibacillus filiformis TaxID=200990 RepID=A0ABU0DV24_9BACI|nr:gamma-glutamyl:cysteine ligase YbdK (ATP-grasp superfamily) [Alkalibacillus filiformis]